MSAMAPQIALIGTQRNSWREKFPTQNWSCSKAKATTTWRLVQRQRTGRSDNLSDNWQTQKGGRSDPSIDSLHHQRDGFAAADAQSGDAAPFAEIDVGAILAEKRCSSAVQSITVRAFMPAWAMTTFDGAAPCASIDQNAKRLTAAQKMTNSCRWRLNRISYRLHALRILQRRQIARGLI